MDVERDACGTGFVADLHGRPSHATLSTALRALRRLGHRGAIAADGETGDGAGILMPLPPAFLAWLAADLRLDALPAGVAMCFLDGDPRAGRLVVERACAAEGIAVIGWRTVPVDLGALGPMARRCAPRVEQALLSAPTDGTDAERRAFRARKRVEGAARRAGVGAYVASLSFRTVTYKALCTADQLGAVYPDLTDPDVAVSFAVFHQRFSTNTTPSWARAQPFRMLCHNGEINTIQGNVNLMRAREGALGLGGDDEDLVRPVIDADGSDSAMLDNALELLVRGGRGLLHSVAMLVPRAWEAMDLDPSARDFFRAHACLLEPWDGPAGLIVSDGVRVAAALDRNGLRPLRYTVIDDDTVVCASEAGVVDPPPGSRVRRGRLGPGEILCVDPEAGGLLEDGDVVSTLSASGTYGAWLADHVTRAEPGGSDVTPPDDLTARQLAFGFTKEEITVVLRAMATDGHEPTSSMGDDTAAPPLASRPRPVTNYLKQRFAQVTNPPIDHLRERAVMSTTVRLGRRPPLLGDGPAQLRELPTFVLSPPGVPDLDARVLDATFDIEEGADGVEAACRRLAGEAVSAVRTGTDLLVISDDAIGASRAPVPMVLAVGAVHHALVGAGLRTAASIVADAGDARDPHDVACLLGYGAEAVCPRTAMEVVTALAHEGRLGAGAPPAGDAVERLRSALEEGVLKIMSKMGISAVESYRAAQVFEALGLGHEVIDLCLTGTPSPLGGVGFRELGHDVLRRHAAAYRDRGEPANPGFIKHRAGGEYHATNPDVVDALQSVARDERAAAHLLQRGLSAGDDSGYRRFADLVVRRPPAEPRDLLEVTPGRAVPLADVEPADAITRRFSAGAMSHGALSAEAHETVARAMRLVGGRANSGEGGEDRGRFGDDRNCGIKQIASGRFGVTPEYCAAAEELQIKMAQGSKPGEGGQLPGTKVTGEIARLRHTPPGVALISPPPHHDIYSIEDLAQLIHDLRQVNPRALVSVKLVSSVGVGTIACGVAKAGADVIHIAGSDGGTGASPLGSIKSAGLPWEIGLVEAHRALSAAGLRTSVRLRTDGGLKSGRDVVIAALLGADEYSFGTALLVALGCIMVRTCHRDTCPVGIASQRPDLRARFAGTPEMVAAYLVQVAEDVRRLLAEAGLRSIDEAVGRADLLGPRRDVSAPFDVAALTVRAVTMEGSRPRPSAPPSLGDRLRDEALPHLLEGRIGEIASPIANTDRAVGASLGGEVARRCGDRRPPGRVRVRLEGSAGQSLGAFLVPGVELDLTGEANDYVGKGMAGGRIVIRPPADDAGDPVLLGNTALYGATGGTLFCAGRAGERLAVRNSGAVAVVEGAGDHACEYMTGGAVVILGPVGRNLAAGMSGGEAYVWDPDGRVDGLVNTQLVEIRPPTGGQLPSLRRLLDLHERATGSSRVRSILAAWETERLRFVRIVARAEVALIEAALEGTRGAGA